MNFDFLKNKREHITVALLVISVILAVIIGIRLIAFGVSYIRMPGLIDSAVSKNVSDAAEIEKYLAESKSKAEQLKKANRFAPPKPAPTPPNVTGILGDQVLINGKWTSVGEMAGEAKIVAIDAAEITIEWQGKEMKLAPIKAAGSAGPPSSPDAEAAKKDRPSSRRGGRPDKASPDERKKMQEEMANMSPQQRREYIKQMRRSR